MDDIDKSYFSFTAEQAKVICKENMKENMHKGLIEVLKIIKSKAGQGETETYYYSPINPMVKKDLENRGFKLKLVADPKDGDYYIISW